MLLKYPILLIFFDFCCDWFDGKKKEIVSVKNKLGMFDDVDVFL